MAGLFVTFEGAEGAGKTTVIEGVRKALATQGADVIVTREPGSGEIGQEIRRILLESTSLPHLCELFLFLADRAQHVERVIRPALAAGQIVLCDRYADSTIVYQGYGRGLELSTLRELNRLATGALQPDLSLLLDIDPQVGLSRLESKDRLDREPLEFHMRIREGFLAESQRDQRRWVVLDADQPVEHVIDGALKAILSRNPRKARP
jgi:dTMP kinase